MAISEMIGNYFFLTHSYERAVPILEEYLRLHPEHLKARKKLIIAYIETGRLRDGYRLYFELLTENPAIILDTDPKAEDCPCPDLASFIGNGHRSFDDPANRVLVLGIYESYCDARTAIELFREYQKLVPEDPQVPQIIEILNQRAQ